MLNDKGEIFRWSDKVQRLTNNLSSMSIVSPEVSTTLKNCNPLISVEKLIFSLNPVKDKNSWKQDILEKVVAIFLRAFK